MAAVLRDRIADLSSVLQQQTIDAVDEGERDVDIIAVAQMEGMFCVNLAMVRGGRHLGNRGYFPKGLRTTSGELPFHAEILEAFITQHYLEESAEDATGNLIPPVLVLNYALQSANDDLTKLNESPPENLHELLNA